MGDPAKWSLLLPIWTPISFHLRSWPAHTRDHRTMESRVHYVRAVTFKKNAPVPAPRPHRPCWGPWDRGPGTLPEPRWVWNQQNGFSGAYAQAVAKGRTAWAREP